MVKVTFDVINPDGNGFYEEIGPINLAFVAAMNDKGDLLISKQYGINGHDPEEVMISLAQAVKHWTGCLAKKATEEAKLEKNLEFLKEFSRILVVDAAGSEWIDGMDEDLKYEA